MTNNYGVSNAAKVGVDCHLRGANPPIFSALHFDPDAPRWYVEIGHACYYPIGLQRGTSGGATRATVGYRVNQHAGVGFAEPSHDGHLFRMFEGI